MKKRGVAGAALALSLAGSAALAAAEGKLEVEIQNIPAELLLVQEETAIDVEGRASVFGGLKYLDLMLILDASKSLNQTDPDDYRLKGAVALVRALPAKSDIHIGIVAFDSDAFLVAPLTADRDEIVAKLEGIRRDGGTNLHDGIRRTLEAFKQGARPDSARIGLLFTDGKSDRDAALLAAQEARDSNVVIHSLLLQDREKATELLQAIASTTQGSFLYVEDPAQLPKAFLDLRTTGVDHVKLSVNGGPPIATEFVAGTFGGRVQLSPGKNVIAATATDLEGKQKAASVEVTVTGPLRVAIAKPVDGTLFTSLETSTAVEVNATVFTNSTPAVRTAFPTLGVESVTLAAEGAPPIHAKFLDGKFVGHVPLRLQENRIVATARSLDGRTAEAFVDLTVRPPGCSELRVSAERDGRPAISLNDRGLEIIFDASNSMWAQIAGTPRITIAKDTVREAMTSLPEDFFVALRVYGHQHQREQKNCTDSELLIPLSKGNSEEIRRVIDSFKPRGQTPLGYSVQQVPADFGDFAGERAVVLITDGIESCDGDAVAAAQAFQQEGRFRPIHVIGFALEQGEEEALASLRRIAETTDGKFIMAGDAAELRRALAETAGTSFTLWRGSDLAGRGTLGAGDVLELPDGAYRLQLSSEPPLEFSFTLGAEESLALTLTRQGEQTSTRESREPAAYKMCPPARR